MHHRHREPDPFCHRPAPWAVAALECEKVAAELSGLEDIPRRLMNVASFIVQMEIAMARAADAIHALQQQNTQTKADADKAVAQANADRDTALADAAKFQADSQTLADLRSQNRIEDDADLAAIAGVLDGNDSTGGNTGDAGTSGQDATGDNGPAAVTPVAPPKPVISQ